MSMLDLRGQIRVLDGNRAGRYGVFLLGPDVISSYPITPQTPLLETLYKFEAEGLLDAEMIEPEGENSAMGSASGRVRSRRTDVHGNLFPGFVVYE